MDINIIDVIQQYAVIPVTVACLLIGWLVKHIIEIIENKWIPLILVAVGIVGVLWLNAWAFTPQNAMAGLCSAALAVWIHNNYKNMTEKPPEP